MKAGTKKLPEAGSRPQWEFVAYGLAASGSMPADQRYPHISSPLMIPLAKDRWKMLEPLSSHIQQRYQELCLP